MNKKEYMSEADLISMLNFEEENGYPSFKNEIARILHEEYNVSRSAAERIAWNKALGVEIAEDIEWSEHMGPNYFAKLILERYKRTIPRKKERLVPQ